MTLASTNGVRSIIAELSPSVWALSTLRVAVESGMLEALIEPCSLDALAERVSADAVMVAAVLDVLEALGLVERVGHLHRVIGAVRRELETTSLAVVRADLRATMGQSARFVDDARRADLRPGWRHTDEELIAAQGTLSRAIQPVALGSLLPALDGALERLASGTASFLDVGAGAAGHCIGICELFPGVRAVGLEPADAPYRVARAAVDASPHCARIELRKQPVAELSDRNAFDLAYVAQMFLPDAVLAEGLARVHAALRPGAWMMTAAVAWDGEGLAPALSRLRGALWGGGRRTIADVETFATAAGFVEPRRIDMPGMPGGAFAARRADITPL